MKWFDHALAIGFIVLACMDDLAHSALK